MADSDVRKALVTAALAFFTGQSLDTDTQVAWENKTFDPRELSVWAACYTQKAGPAEASTLGLGGRDREVGFLQIDINLPRDSGEEASDNWWDAARAYFVKGRSFTYGSKTVTIENIGSANGRLVETWWRETFTISYRSDLTRNPSL